MNKNVKHFLIGAIIGGGSSFVINSTNPLMSNNQNLTLIGVSAVGGGLLWVVLSNSLNKL